MPAVFWPAELGVLQIDVSAHPDVILQMGTKEVLVATKSFRWGSDCHIYSTATQLGEELPHLLASGETRVLKQYRGNGSIGVYRVALRERACSGESTAALDAVVHTQHARRGSALRDMTPVRPQDSRRRRHLCALRDQRERSAADP